MLACASVFVVLKEGQGDMDPFVFSSLRFIIAAAAFSPILRGGALKDPHIVRGGIELGIWAAGGAHACGAGGGCGRSLGQGVAGASRRRALERPVQSSRGAYLQQRSRAPQHGCPFSGPQATSRRAWAWSPRRPAGGRS